MTLIEPEAVTERNRIFNNLQSNTNAQIINRELLLTFLIEVDNGTIGNSAESVVPVHCLFEKTRLQHEQHGFP